MSLGEKRETSWGGQVSRRLQPEREFARTRDGPAKHTFDAIQTLRLRSLGTCAAERKTEGSTGWARCYR